MRINLIDDDFQAKIMGVHNKRIKVVKRPENWIDIAIICNIITEILHR